MHLRCEVPGRSTYVVRVCDVVMQPVDGAESAPRSDDGDRALCGTNGYPVVGDVDPGDSAALGERDDLCRGDAYAT
jgi:hypothetical protein